MKRLVSVNEASMALGISVSTVRNLIRAGVITPTRIGYRVFLPIEVVDRLAKYGVKYRPHNETSVIAQTAAV